MTKLAHNITFERDGDTLLISVDLNADDAYTSPSGKSDVLATTRGNVRLPGFATGEVVKLGLNIFRVR